MTKENSAAFFFYKWLRLELIPNSLLWWASEQIRKKMRSTWGKGNYRLSQDTSLKPVLGLNRAVSEDLAWEVTDLESWNYKDFFHYSMDFYVRNVEINSLGRCTRSNCQVWYSSVSWLCQDHGLGSQSSSTVLFTSSLSLPSNFCKGYCSREVFLPSTLMFNLLGWI